MKYLLFGVMLIWAYALGWLVRDTKCVAQVRKELTDRNTRV